MSEKAERLVNLTVALLAAGRPVTFTELRRRMGEWQDGAPESMRRKFERDKEELRRLGVPIETVTIDALSGELAYRVDPSRYSLPDVELTVGQVTALAVAFQLVDGGADRLTFTQLAARAPDPAEAAVPSGISVRADVDPVAPLATAIVERRVVRFTHRKPTGEETERELEPTAIVARRGTWYVRGHDRTRAASRVFRTDRIVGEVVLTDEPAIAEPDEDEAEQLAAMFELPDEIELEVAVRDGDGWELEVRRDRWFRAVSRALGAAPDEVVVRPADAHRAVREGLEAVLAAHDEPTGAAS